MTKNKKNLTSESLTPLEFKIHTDICFNFQQKQKREAAYKAEADPINFMYQRGEATQEEWLAKVADIKARFPYQE